MYTFLNGFRPVTQARRINNNIDSISKDPNQTLSSFSDIMLNSHFRNGNPWVS